MYIKTRTIKIKLEVRVSINLVPNDIVEMSSDPYQWPVLPLN